MQQINAPSLQFKFPTTVTECKEVAEEFTFRSQAGFNNCVGCIDGMLVWTEKPLSTQCDKVRVDSGKFLWMEGQVWVESTRGL